MKKFTYKKHLSILFFHVKCTVVKLNAIGNISPFVTKSFYDQLFHNALTLKHFFV